MIIKDYNYNNLIKFKSNKKQKNKPIFFVRHHRVLCETIDIQANSLRLRTANCSSKALASKRNEQHVECQPDRCSLNFASN